MCGQTTCKQAWRAANPEIRCPSATHMHKHKPMHGNGPASVHHKPAGLQMLRQGKKTGANTQTFLSDAEHICRLSEVTRESTDSALKNIKPALKNQPRGRRVPVGWDPLQGLIHLHITLSVLSRSSAPQRHPSLPKCAAVYVKSGYDRSWTEAPHLQHEQMRSRFLPTSLTADLFLVCKATSILNHWILESNPAVSG